MAFRFRRKQKKILHSFPELLGKRIQVPVYEFRPFFSDIKEINSFRITDQERIKVALSKAEKMRTSLDD